MPHVCSLYVSLNVIHRKFHCHHHFTFVCSCLLEQAMFSLAFVVVFSCSFSLLWGSALTFITFSQSFLVFIFSIIQLSSFICIPYQHQCRLPSCILHLMPLLHNLIHEFHTSVLAFFTEHLLCLVAIVDDTAMILIWYHIYLYYQGDYVTSLWLLPLWFSAPCWLFLLVQLLYLPLYSQS